MNDDVTYADYELRLRIAALDRALNCLHAEREISPDDVIVMASKFETYLRG